MSVAAVVRKQYAWPTAITPTGTNDACGFLNGRILQYSQSSSSKNDNNDEENRGRRRRKAE